MMAKMIVIKQVFRVDAYVKACINRVLQQIQIQTEFLKQDLKRDNFEHTDDIALW